MQSQEEFLLAWTVKDTSEKLKHELSFPRINYRNFSLTNPEIQDYEPDFFIHCGSDRSVSTNLPPAEMENIDGIPIPVFQSAQFTGKEEIPEMHGWLEYCAKIQNAISAGELKKIVPARVRKFFAEKEISPVQALQSLFSKFSQVKELHLFCVAEGDFVFLGASPELLFKKRKNEIFVPAVAGTRKRDLKNSINDDAIAAELIQSKKELAEHRIVVDFLLEKLKTIAEIKSSSEKLSLPQVLKLPTLQHLYTPIRAEILPKITGEKISALEIVSLLHPTPAMCGFPQEKAFQFIEKNEGWQRGLFSAPLGYYYENEAKFIVGIRSALIKNKIVHLFAGAGFVEGSCAKSEWNETDQKMRSLEEVFAVDI